MRNKERPYWAPSISQEWLLKAALWRGDEAVEAWDQWRKAADIARVDFESALLLPLVYRNLEGQIRDPWMNTLGGIYRRTWFQNQLLIHQIKPVLKVLQQKGYAPSLLKGAAMVHGYYKDLGLRPMQDADIWIQEKDVAQAGAILENQGWKQKIIAPWHAVTFKKAESYSIDLHWNSLAYSGNTGVDDQFRESLQMLDFGGISLGFLNPSDQFIHVCVHGARKGVNGYNWERFPTIRWIADAERILAMSSLDWERIFRLSRDLDAALQMRDALTYLSEAMRLPIPEQILRSFRSLVPTTLERIHYRYTMQAPPKGYFNRLFSYLGIYFFWVRCSFDHQSVNHWNFSQFFQMFFSFFKKRHQLQSSAQIFPWIVRRIFGRPYAHA